MGTNFYKVRTLTREQKDKLIRIINDDGLIIDEYDNVRFHDKNGDEVTLPRAKTRIGKRSGGWKFLFDHNDWKFFPRDKDKFVEWVNDPVSGRIMDEYGKEYTPEQFWEDEVMPTYTDPWIDGKERFDSASYDKWSRENGEGSQGIHDFYLDDLRFSIHSDFS